MGEQSTPQWGQQLCAAFVRPLVADCCNSPNWKKGALQKNVLFSISYYIDVG